MGIPEIHTVEDCIFCSKKVKGKSFCSTSKFSAIYNLSPVLPGHSLIIPNTHYTSLAELKEEDLAEMTIFARKITSVLKTAFQCDGFDWTIQDGISAGQTVPHLHLHVIPRKPFDLNEAEEWYSKISNNEKQFLDSQSREKLNDQEYDEITSFLNEACKKIEF